MRRTGLRVLAVSAPEHSSGLLGSGVLKSSDPASMFNACRHAAAIAQSGSGPWADSNWNGSRSARRDSLLLMHSVDEDSADLDAAFDRVRPQLLLIGAMTMCLPGAVFVAQRARERLGHDVCIVLGGWHATETIYRKPGRPDVLHHPSSPLRLAAEGLIRDDLFDVVVSGEGEYLISAFGELIAKGGAERPGRFVQSQLDALTMVPGNWICGYCRDRSIHTLVNGGIERTLADLPPPSTLFGVKAAFDVFDGAPTAHVFSDYSRGCVYDCAFCSERVASAGRPGSLEGAAARLHRQMVAAGRTIGEDYPGSAASAFCEDSILLGGSTLAIQQFVRLSAETPPHVSFGCQLTVDQVITKKAILPQLASVGMKYAFIGLETLEPLSIGGLSKDVRPQFGWGTRMTSALELLGESGIKTGVAILFGLGESQDQRLRLVEQLSAWRRALGGPHTISLNWAVQHPLRGEDGGTNYRYLEWGLPNVEWTTAFAHFGEASVLYPLVGRRAPDLQDVVELNQALDTLARTSLPSPTSVENQVALSS
jgi:B12-binding domain/radical SAM domain protein